MRRLFSRDVLKVMGLVALVRAVYLASTPFVMEGDAHHYFRYMMEPFRSNLLHASGYPFLLHFTLPLADFLHVGRITLLRLVQNGIPVLACGLLYRALRDPVGRKAAFFSAFLVGTNFFSMTEANLSMPEFLLEAWLVLLISGFVFARTTNDLRLKQALYFAAGPLFAMGYLIKYNFAAFAVIFAVLWLDEALSLRRRLAVFTGAVVSGAALVGAYVVWFHQPTTGSYALNLEHGWVHMLKLHRGGMVPRPTDGPATLKYLTLSRLMPEALDCCSQNFLRIDSVPEAIRAPVRARFAPLLAETDFAVIRRSYEEAGRPSSTYEPFQRLYYYLGLAEAEALLRGVFFEAVRADPVSYLADMGKHLKEGLVEKHRRYLIRTPVPEASSFLVPRLYDRETGCRVLPRSAGSWYVESRSVNCPSAQYLGPKKFWLPGLWLTLQFAWPHLLSAWIFWPLVLAAAGVALRTGRRQRSPSESLLLLSLGLSVSFALVSVAIFQIREKELLILQPLLCLSLVLSVGILRSVRWAMPLRRIFFRGIPQSPSLE